ATLTLVGREAKCYLILLPTEINLCCTSSENLSKIKRPICLVIDSTVTPQQLTQNVSNSNLLI
ncbi:MAG: hypothetical protein RR939_09010, partial [Acinetobacter sp.]